MTCRIFETCFNKSRFSNFKKIFTFLFYQQLLDLLEFLTEICFKVNKFKELNSKYS